MKSNQAQLRQAMRLQREKNKLNQQKISKIQFNNEVSGILKSSSIIKTISKKDDDDMRSTFNGNDDSQIQSIVENGEKKKNRVCFKSDPPEVKIIENRIVSSTQDEMVEMQPSNDDDNNDEILDPETEKEFEDLLNIEPEIYEDNMEENKIQSEILSNRNTTIEKDPSQSDGGKSQTKMDKTVKKKKKKTKFLNSNASDLTNVEQVAYEARLARLMLLAKKDSNAGSSVKEVTDLPTLAFHENMDESDLIPAKENEEVVVNSKGLSWAAKNRDHESNKEVPNDHIRMQNSLKRKTSHETNENGKTKQQKSKSLSVLDILRKKREAENRLVLMDKDKDEEENDLYWCS